MSAPTRVLYCNCTYAQVVPKEVKSAVCGTGRAGKDQVQRMVGALLNLPEPPEPDHAADALAVAICHANGVATRTAVGLA